MWAPPSLLPAALLHEVGLAFFRDRELEHGVEGTDTHFLAQIGQCPANPSGMRLVADPADPDRLPGEGHRPPGRVGELRAKLIAHASFAQ